MSTPLTIIAELWLKLLAFGLLCMIAVAFCLLWIHLWQFALVITLIVWTVACLVIVGRQSKYRSMR